MCLRVHLVTLLLLMSFAGMGVGRWAGVAVEAGPWAHSSPVSEAQGLQACSLQCFCCPLSSHGWVGCMRVGLGEFCL